MYIVSKSTNEQIECRLVAKGPMDNMLQIYTNELTPIQAYTFFDDAENMERLTITKLNDDTKEVEETHIMKGFNEIFAVQKPLIFMDDKKMVMIVLRKNIEVQPL